KRVFSWNSQVSSSGNIGGVEFVLLNRPSQSIKGVLAAIALRCLNPQPLCFQVSIPARPVLTIENRHYLAIASGMPALRKLVKSCFIAFFPQLLSRGVIRVETCALRREVHRASGDHHHAERTSLPAGGNPRPALHRAVSLNRPQDRAPPTVLNFFGNPENHLPKGFLGRSWLPHSLSGGSHGFLEPLELVVRQKHVVSGTDVKVPLRVVERSSQLRRPTPEGRHLRENRPKSSSPFQRRECGAEEGT